jgi:hypothetical protein
MLETGLNAASFIVGEMIRTTRKESLLGSSRTIPKAPVPG